MTTLELQFQPSQMPEFVARELLDELAALGYDARMAEAPELRGGAPFAGPILIWVSEHLGDAAISAIVGAVVAWVTRKVPDRTKRPPEVRVLFKPNGDVLRRVEMPDEDGGSD